METEIIRLYNTDYVIILRLDNSFFSFSSGEIVIYSDLNEALKDAKELNGFVTSCKSLAPVKQEEILTNIIQHLK